MQREDLVGAAETCRSQARHFDNAERALLLKIATTFDELARRAEARETIAATRCW